MPEGNPRLAEIIGSNLHIDAVPHANPDKVFAHLSGNMRQDFVPVWQSHAEHSPREHLGDSAL